MAAFEDVMELDIQSFFRYIETIRYGYQDKSGHLHFTDDEDFTVRDYAFSSPEDVVENNCGWCWDLAELIKVYCARHDLPCRSWFMEYLSDELHQTHTQVFLLFQGKWCPAPDNSLGLQLGTPCFDELSQCVSWFTDFFTDYLKSVLKDKFDESNLLVKEYTRTFSPGITDEEYLLQIRQ
ncbi:MAG: hypothetical protein J1F24_01035 [Oscillospiraceae bacterium]|nr:hypothetical protein [Oscillospiraceae bacterium]